MSAVSPSTSITLEVRYPSRSGMLARITGAIAAEGAVIRNVTILASDGGKTTRAIDVEGTDEAHERRIALAVGGLAEVELLRCSDRTFALHQGGKIAIANRVPLNDRDSLSRAYTPGVARVCLRVKDDLDAAYRLTVKQNMIAIVSDGSAVLGLGNIGPYGALPVMEGKAMLFKTFGGVDAFPICLDTQDTEQIIATVCNIAPVFGGVNLEDIAAPRCFEIEERLQAKLEIPIFHDDQHGTAVVVAAGLLNALKVTQQSIGDIRVVISGAGAAGLAVAKLLLRFGVGDLILCDSKGAIYAGRGEGMNPYKDKLAEQTNRDNLKGHLEDVIRGADVCVGVSQPNVLSGDGLKSMAEPRIVFALANPIPEVDPEAAHAHARVVATGRSDLPNQINNAIAFPGIFRGLLDARASRVVPEMLVAAAKALAGAVPDEALTEDYIIPSLFQEGLSPLVSKAVYQVAVDAGVAREHAPVSDWGV